MFVKRLYYIAAVFMIMLMAVGCGKKNTELEEYKANMTEFYDNLAEYDSAINSIDSSSEGSKQELLEVLDRMNETYQKMGQYKVPAEFSGISDISVEAAEYMQKANEYYHLAYDGEFSEENEELATQYYERANNRAMVMLQVLHGEGPSGEGVSVTTEDAYQLSTIDSSTE